MIPLMGVGKVNAKPSGKDLLFWGIHGKKLNYQHAQEFGSS